MAYQSFKMLTTIIAPLFSRGDTVLIGITTPIDEHNWFSILFNLRGPDGEYAFNRYAFTGVCAACSKLDNPEACTHTDHLKPWWLRGAKVGLTRMLFGSDTTAYQREIQGVESSATGGYFSKRSMRLFRTATPVSLLAERLSVPRIFVACDPNASGFDTPDETAFAAIAVHRGRVQVRYSMPTVAR